MKQVYDQICRAKDNATPGGDAPRVHSQVLCRAQGEAPGGTLRGSAARSCAKHREWECSWGTLRGSAPRSCASRRDAQNSRLNMIRFVGQKIAVVASGGGPTDGRPGKVGSLSNIHLLSSEVSAICCCSHYCLGSDYQLNCSGTRRLRISCESIIKRKGRPARDRHDMC